MELKTPQLTLAKIAWMGRHETVNTRSEQYNYRVMGSVPVRGNFFANLFCSNTILADLTEWSNLLVFFCLEPYSLRSGNIV